MVHSLLMGGLLHLVQRGGAWAGRSPPSPLIAVSNVTAHPSTATVPTSCYSMRHYNSLCPLKGSSSACRIASECSHFRTRPRFWPCLAPVKISWCYVERFRSYRVDKHTQIVKCLHEQIMVETARTSSKTATFRRSGRSREWREDLRQSRIRHCGARIVIRSWTWVGLSMGRVGSQNYPSWVGRVRSGPVSKMSNKYATYMQQIRRV